LERNNGIWISDAQDTLTRNLAEEIHIVRTDELMNLPLNFGFLKNVEKSGKPIVVFWHPDRSKSSPHAWFI
jgi:hypothetical protein